MIKIVNTPPVRPSEASRRKPSSSSVGGDFTKFLQGAEEASEPAETAPTAGVNSFLFLQEISDEEAKRQKAMQRGKQALAALEQLHRDLLLGHIPESTLLKLEHTVAKQREEFVEPRLHQLLDEIELRVAVEIAKLQQARL